MIELCADDMYVADGDWTLVIYRFMCNSSCVGNLSRRAVTAVFTLESAAGEVLGRQVVGLRVCACPGRDREADETATNTSSSLCGKTLKRSNDTRDVNESSSRKLPRLEDNRIFTLKVQHLRHFTCQECLIT